MRDAAEPAEAVGSAARPMSYDDMVSAMDASLETATRRSMPP